MNQRLSRRGSEVAKPTALPRLPRKGSSWYNLAACLETTHTQQLHKSFNPCTHNRWQNSTNTTSIIRVRVHGGRLCRLGRSSSLNFHVYYKSFTSKYSPCGFTYTVSYADINNHIFRQWYAWSVTRVDAHCCDTRRRVYSTPRPVRWPQTICLIIFIATCQYSAICKLCEAKKQYYQ